MKLPGRSLDEEDAYVASLLDAPADALIEAIDAAMTAKRPLLAARLVGLLPDDAGASAAVEAARKAAGMLLVGEESSDGGWDGLEEAWAELRRRRVRRTRNRLRRTRAREWGRD